MLVRLIDRSASLVLALAPVTAFGWLLTKTDAMADGGALNERLNWVPSLDLNLIVADTTAAVLLLLGAFLCLAAAVGLVRFPDVLSRMHSATKPQTLGLLLIVLGVGLTLRTWNAWRILSLVFVLQLLTPPVAAHMVGRAAYRSGQVSEEFLERDELADALRKAEQEV